MSSMAESSSNNNNEKSNSDRNGSGGEEEDTFDSSNSKGFVKTLYKHDTYPYTGPRTRRRRASTFDMSNVQQHNLLEMMKFGVWLVLLIILKELIVL